MSSVPPSAGSLGTRANMAALGVASLRATPVPNHRRESHAESLRLAIGARSAPGIRRRERLRALRR
eukprot:7104865-Pyramimonas_sp.AAC.1